MTKGEWIDVIKNTMAKVDEQGIYRRPLIERHIQSVYEQMFNELYTQDKRSIWHYVRDYEVSVAYADWYLPTIADLEASSFIEGDYWTSNEVSATHAYSWSSVDGAVSTLKATSKDVWPIRYFEANSDDFSVGGLGLAGGTIISSDASGFYEMAPASIGSSEWSNVTDTLVGTGASSTDGSANTDLIVAQTGHSTSAAQDCLDHSVSTANIYLPTGYELDVLPVSFNRRGGGLFRFDSTGKEFVVTDKQGYVNATDSKFDTSYIAGAYFVYMSADALYGNVYISGGESTYSIIPKFTALSATDEVLIPNGAEDHFIDRIIDTIQHLRPTDLINDNTIQ